MKSHEEKRRAYAAGREHFELVVFVPIARDE
jgi:hypothetical protein